MFALESSAGTNPIGSPASRLCSILGRELPLSLLAAAYVAEKPTTFGGDLLLGGLWCLRSQSCSLFFYSSTIRSFSICCFFFYSNSRIFCFPKTRFFGGSDVDSVYFGATFSSGSCSFFFTCIAKWGAGTCAAPLGCSSPISSVDWFYLGYWRPTSITSSISTSLC